MKLIAFPSFGAATMMLSLLTGQAQAEPALSWFSSTGTSGPCTRFEPCLFGDAYASSSPGGEILCADSGYFGDFTITKAITVDCTGYNGRFNNLTINVPADATVILKGLVFRGGNNVQFQSGGALIVENCRFHYGLDFGVLQSVAGIRFRPSSLAKLTVTDSLFSNNGVGSTGGAIVVNPQGGGSAQVVLNRVTVTKNVFGIVADGTGSTGGINMTISDSVSNGNSQDGIIAVTPAGGAPIGVMVKNTKSTNNAIGIRSIGPNVTVRVDGSSVVGNGTGLSFSGGGALLSFGNNAVQANGTNGAFSGSVGLQ